MIHNKAKRINTIMFNIGIAGFIVSIIGTIFSVIGAIPVVKDFTTINIINYSLVYNYLPYFFIVFYIYILLYAAISQKDLNFIPTIALRFRYFFVFILILYAFYLKSENKLTIYFLLLIILYLAYCFLLTRWMLKPTYGDGRELRCVIDIIFSSSFFLFCGDPYLIFYSHYSYQYV